MEDVIYSKYSWLHGGALCDFHRLRCQTESPVTDSWGVQIIPRLDRWQVGDPALHACGVVILENWLQIYFFGVCGGERSPPRHQVELNHRRQNHQRQSSSSTELHNLYNNSAAIQPLISWSSCCYRTISCQGFSSAINYSYLAALLIVSLSVWISLCSHLIIRRISPLRLPATCTSPPSTCLSISFLLFSSSSCSPVCLRGSVPVQVGIRETQRKLKKSEILWVCFCLFFFSKVW